MKYKDMTDEERFAWARSFKDPRRRDRAISKVLEDIAARSVGNPMIKRKKRPAGGGIITRGS